MTGTPYIIIFAALTAFNALGVYGVWHDFGIFNGLSVILSISAGVFAWCAVVTTRDTKQLWEHRQEGYSRGFVDGRRNRRERRDRNRQRRNHID